MKAQAAVVAAVQRDEWNRSQPAGGLLHALARGLVRGMETAQVYIDHHAEARAGKELCRHLWRLSDEELARRGLRRDQIGEYVRRGL